MRIIYFIISALLLFSCKNDTPKTEEVQNEIAKKEAKSIVSEDRLKAEPSKTIDKTTLEVTTEGGKTEEFIIEKTTTEDQKIIVADKKNVETSDKVGNTDLPITLMPKQNFSGVYSQILKNFVSTSGKVNYAGIKTNRTMLSQATQYFEETPPQSSWSKNQKIAYWINAYNLYTLELVVDNYPVKSIKDIAGGKPWDKKFIKLDGRNLSLNDIENGILRKDYNEPRIHFAVNCASISCPKLSNKSYTASNLNRLLDAQTKRFIRDGTMNMLLKESVEISQLFEWYKSDFGDILTYLNKYSTMVIYSDAKITYKDYNWNLNK